MYSALFSGEKYLWNRLANEQKPVALYGMGDGADRAMRLCEQYGVPVAGVFANDAFVRGQSFHGFPVRTLSRLEEDLPEFTALLCFATERPEVLDQIRAVAARHTLLVPDFPVAGEAMVTPDFLREHRERLQEASHLLADEQSRHVLWNVLRAKLTGEMEPLIAAWSDREQAWDTLLRPGPDEYLVDAGAYTGDTLTDFLRRTGGRCRGALAIEPDRRNFRRLAGAVEAIGNPRIRCVNTAVWREPDTLPFRHRSGRCAGIAEGAAETVNADSVDRLLAGEAASIIQYDVEGAEREALLGSAQTLRLHRPRLAVAAYHRAGDLFELPLLLNELRPDYHIYLRQHLYLPAWETVLYAI